MGQGQTKSLPDQIFQMKFASKNLERQSKKCEKDEKKERTKVKKAMEAGNMDIARVYAENAIRHKQQALNLLRLSARLDAVAMRMETAQTMNQVTRQMAQVTRTLGMTINSINLEQSALTMEQFDKQMEDMDVTLAVMENGLNMSVVQTTPVTQVEDLMSQVTLTNNPINLNNPINNPWFRMYIMYRLCYDPLCITCNDGLYVCI